MKTVAAHRLFSSLQLRLLLGLVCVFGLGGAAMLGLMRVDALGPHNAVEETSLSTQAKSLLAGLRVDAQGRLLSIDIPRAWRSAYRTRQAAFFTLYGPTRRILAQSSNLAAPLAYHTAPAGQSIGPMRLEGPQQNLVLSAAGPAGLLLVVGRTSPGRFDEAHPDFVEDFAPALLFVVFAVIGLVVAGTVAVFSLRPLVIASREAAAIGPETSARLTERALPTEARPLARAVNAALDRVSAAYEAEKQFTADAAHALRTPLTVLDLRLQRAQSDGQVDWPDIRRDLAELARLVSGLLTLSRAERDSQTQKSRVNLARLAREAAAAFMLRIDLAGRDIEVAAPDQAMLAHADPNALRDMLAALIDNALSHGAGRITLEIKPDVAGGWTVRIADEGSGVSEDAWEAVFQRFHKLDANSGGAGLGLAITRQTARNHRGEARFIAPAMVEVNLPNE